VIGCWRLLLVWRPEDFLSRRGLFFATRITRDPHMGEPGHKPMGSIGYTRILPWW
jgi:hypothetical protein